MADLKRQVASQGSALARRSQGGNVGRDKKVTTSRKKTSTTHGISPTPFRLTIEDKADLQDWVDELQEQTSRDVSGAKVLRGLIAIKDDLPDEVNEMLLAAIKELR